MTVTALSYVFAHDKREKDGFIIENTKNKETEKENPLVGRQKLRGTV